jgi:K+-transporting ATPase ATPase C chain
MNDAKVNYPTSHRKLTMTAEPGGSLLGHIWASIGATIVLGIICCGIYPLLVYGIGQLFFPVQANGSLLKADGSFTTNDKEAVGSSLIAQGFSLPIYFHPRPSANSYDATNSGGSNLGPLSDKLINGLPPAPPTTQATTQMATTQPATTQMADTQPAATQMAAATQPAATQPAPTVQFDGIRLRTIHYAVDNNIPFKLYFAVYNKQTNPDGSVTVTIERKMEAPKRANGTYVDFEDDQGNPNDVALVNAFPHPAAPNGGSGVIFDGPDFAPRTMVIAGDFGTLIPGDAVTASGSGLDPHISPANAKLQAARVAAARSIPGRTVSATQVQALVDTYTDGPDLGILGDPGVNVLRLNLALDKNFPMPAATTAPTTAPSTQPAGH